MRGRGAGRGAETGAARGAVIVPFTDGLASAFSRLNQEWIERLFTIEPADRKILADPRQFIIEPGGQIFFAVLNGDAIGTVAAVRESPRRFELAKMAVTPRHQGQGIGRQLGEAVIQFARAEGASSVFLVTNSALDGAIRLYGRLGFRRGPMPAPSEYARADVYMELSV